MKLFSTEFVNKEAVKNNVVLLLLYIIATPLSKIFVKLKISPNSITVISILFACLAFVSLVLDDGYIYYCIFWLISLHLDFCDGTVARMTGKVNKLAFRFDHMSDLFKLCLIFIGTGIHYDTRIIWILSISTTFSFLYAMILNHDLRSYMKMKPEKVESHSSSHDKHNNEQGSILSRAKKSPILLNLYSFFIGISGHTLILFLIIPFGIIPTEIFFSYIILLTFYRSITVIKRLIKLPKI